MVNIQRRTVALGFFWDMPLDVLSRLHARLGDYPVGIAAIIGLAWRARATGTGETSDHEGATHPSEEHGSVQVECGAKVYAADEHFLGEVDLVQAQEGTFRISRMIKLFRVRCHYPVSTSEIRDVRRGEVFLTVCRSEFFDRPSVMET